MRALIDGTIEVAGRLADGGVLFDDDDPVVDVEISAARTPNQAIASSYEIEPVVADSDVPAHFFVPVHLLDVSATDNVIAALWDPTAEQWTLLPTETIEGGLLLWTPHFSIFGFLEPVGDGLQWVGGKTVDGLSWVGGKTIDGLKALVGFVWDVGMAVVDPIIEGLARLDTALGGVAEGPPECPTGDAEIGFELGVSAENDDDKVLTCHWTVGDRFHLKVTNNRPYGMTAVFDRTVAEAKILAWPTTDRFSADRLLTETFEAIESQVGQAYIPSGATSEITWQASDIDELNVRFEATLANAAIDPALAVLMTTLQVEDLGLAIIEDELRTIAIFDCIVGFVDAVVKLRDGAGVLDIIDAGSELFVNAGSCLKRVFGDGLTDLISIGSELIKMVRNSISLLADSVVEGSAKVRIEMQFVRDLRAPAADSTSATHDVSLCPEGYEIGSAQLNCYQPAPASGKCAIGLPLTVTDPTWRDYAGTGYRLGDRLCAVPRVAGAGESTAPTGRVLLSANGIGDYPFGSDFDDTIEFVATVLGDPLLVERNGPRGCGFLEGCELIAYWDGLTVSGKYLTNTFEFWMADTVGDLSSVFALEGHESLDAARFQQSWAGPANSFILQDTDSWLLSFPGTGIRALTPQPVPPGDWINESPPLPAAAPVSKVYATGDWNRQPPTENREQGTSCDAVPRFNSGNDPACAGRWAVSPQLAAYNAGWYLFENIGGQWVEVDYALTCCRPGHYSTNFTGLLERNRVPADAVVALCDAIGIPVAADRGTCIDDEVSLLSACGTATSLFLARTSGFRVSICSTASGATYVGESIETSASVTLPACQLGTGAEAVWRATSADGYVYQVDSTALLVAQPDNTLILDQVVADSYRDLGWSAPPC